MVSFESRSCVLPVKVQRTECIVVAVGHEVLKTLLELSRTKIFHPGQGVNGTRVGLWCILEGLAESIVGDTGVIRPEEPRFANGYS